MKHILLNKHLLGIVSIVGSVLLIEGAFLPWVTFLGGLQTFSGVSGLNGRIILASGGITLLLGIVSVFKKTSSMQWVIGIVGFLQLCFCSYLLFKLFQTMSGNAMNSMMVAGFGPGLFMSMLGSIFVFASLFIQGDDNNDPIISSYHNTVVV